MNFKSQDRSYDKFDKHCYDTNELNKNLCDWYYMPKIVHKMLMHGSRIIYSPELHVDMLKTLYSPFITVKWAMIIYCIWKFYWFVLRIYILSYECGHIHFRCATIVPTSALHSHIRPIYLKFWDLSNLWLIQAETLYAICIYDVRSILYNLEDNQIIIQSQLYSVISLKNSE